MNAKLIRNTRFLKAVVGFKIIEQSPYHYRISHETIGVFMNLYPADQSYHNIVTRERGHYKTVQRFLELQLGRSTEYLAKIPKGAPNES